MPDCRSRSSRAHRPAISTIDSDVPATSGVAGFVATLSLAMAVAAFPQFVVGALGPVLIAELALSRAQLGSLVTVFFVVAAALSPVVGRLADRLGGRRLMAALFGVEAVAFVAMAGASSYPWLLAAIGLAGVGIAAGNPSTNLLIATHLPPARRGLAIGVKQSGVQVGTLVAGLAIPSIAVAFGWRAALVGAAGVAAAGLAITFVAVPADPIVVRRADTGAVPGGPVASVRWLFPYAFFMGAGGASVTSYVVLYAYEVVGVPQARAGVLLGTIGGVAVLARLAWGRLADQRWTVASSLIVLAMGSIIATALIWAAQFAGLATLWPGVVLFGVSAFAWNVVAMMAVVRDAGKTAAGRVSGMVITGFFLGLLIMPVTFGATVDATGAYDTGWALTAVSFTAALAVAVHWTRATRRAG